MTDEESFSEEDTSSEESDNAATDPHSVAESLESGEEYNDDPASLSISDERYDEDSDLDNAGSQVSAEQELHRPPLGIPPKHDSIPFADIWVTRRLPQQFDQNLAPSVQLYTNTLG